MNIEVLRSILFSVVKIHGKILLLDSLTILLKICTNKERSKVKSEPLLKSKDSSKSSIFFLLA